MACQPNGQSFVRIELWEMIVMNDTGHDRLVVVVLGPPSAVLVGALWSMGLRPMRGQSSGTVWARPDAGGWN
jgi:hypothetical protein